MNRQPVLTRKKSRLRERGMTLIETLIAGIVLMVGLVGLMGAYSLTITQNWNQGDRATRTTEYAQDKMEQLLALNFADSASNTAIYPPTTTGGTGLAVGGSLSLGSPTTGYVDWVDDTGTQQSSAASASYIREWTVAINAASNLKTITVTTTALTSLGGGGIAPSTTLVCTKSLIQ